MATTGMAVLADRDAVVGGNHYISWRSIIAGALAAAALGFVLHGFAAAIGLSLSSTAPTWRDSSVMLTLLAGIYLIFAAIITFGLGGYLAGRASLPHTLSAGPTASASDREELEFRDGTNGLIAWALAVLITVATTYAGLQLATRIGPADTGRSQSSAAENLTAFDLDKLFRSDKAPVGDINYARAEAGRILLTANSHRGVEPDDHDYLARLVERQTGLSAADATRRVDDIVAKSRDNIARARRTAVILAFMAAAATLIGAMIAWGAATAGGRHRDGVAASHLWNWRATNARIIGT
jgi:hypothetical protein